MNPRVLRRFIYLMVIAILVAATFTVFYDSFFNRPPGDYQVEKGDIHLGSREYDEALAYFDKALEISPDHRGAIMGRAVVFIQKERYSEALSELDYLIAFLERNLDEDDPTGRGALAAAHANRGIVLDRRGEYEKALADYIKALQVDAEAVSGPGLADKILYDPTPSTVRDRARYIYEQLKLPENQRLMRVPELDARERMYKP